ncbi:class I SAM-dependent methyltransferase [Luteimonas terricola]|uniref:Methyltransferase n=1 Tax=Luteimonas terricola TaxID=645597 RepID=A0ABQ2EMU9_9GAMM|nr:class I SAM-dependent methyltransferase [Luteimonas terricola]GGK16643.1 methyltransferase [Luteimonas terricola]
MTSFSDADAVAHYQTNAARLVPGLSALHRMAGLLLAEVVPADGRVLVLGAGGGMELKAFAEAHPGWRFAGVDPSPQMLKLAADALGPLARRADLIEGTIDAAPETAFDGASCLLTLHFLTMDERRHTLGELRRRLKPGAPLIVAHHSFDQSDEDKLRWLTRYAAFAMASGVPHINAKAAIEGIGAKLPVLSPDADVALLREAGFERVELFYAAFTFRGWVAYSAP